MDLSVVIPVKDEAANIASLVGEIRAALDGLFDYEIVYVDDGSSDANRRRDLTADADRRRTYGCCATREIAGRAAAIRTGVRAAHATWIATLDGDGQNDPTDIPECGVSLARLRWLRRS